MLEKNKIILGIQYLRGLAALGVVFCHFGSALFEYPIFAQIFNFGQTGIHLFFLVSGFIIVYSLTKVEYKSNQFLGFLVRRSIRIDPPYFITIILTIILFKVLSLIPSFKGSEINFVPQQFIAHLFYLIPFTKYSFYNHVFWTLCVEFQFYLIIGLFYFISSNKIYQNLFLIVFGISCLIPFSNGYYLVFNYAPVFCLGIALVNIYRGVGNYNYILPILFLLLIFYKFGLPITVLMVIGIIIILFTKLNIKPLFFLGNISYSLYLTHSLVLILIVGVLKKLHFDLLKNQLIWLCLEVIIAVIAAYCFYLIIERPSQRLSKKIFYKSLK